MCIVPVVREVDKDYTMKQNNQADHEVKRDFTKMQTNQALPSQFTKEHINQAVPSPRQEYTVKKIGKLTRRTHSHLCQRHQASRNATMCDILNRNLTLPLISIMAASTTRKVKQKAIIIFYLK